MYLGKTLSSVIPDKGGELTSRMECNRSLYQKDCREQTVVCERAKERGEDLLHEWDLEGPALAIGDDALP